jgi:nitrite reductase/ring-hydroxylating ferredoxin subunit
MAGADGWTDVGAAAELAARPLQRIAVGNSEIALSFRDGSFGAVANACNHAGGPLGEGCLDSDYIVCPWHHWKFHRVSGVGEPGSEEDRVPSFPVKVEHGRVLVNLCAATRRTKRPHPPHPLARLVARAPGPLRLAGISTTIMDAAYPRFSGSDHIGFYGAVSLDELLAERRQCGAVGAAWLGLDHTGSQKQLFISSTRSQARRYEMPSLRRACEIDPAFSIASRRPILSGPSARPRPRSTRNVSFGVSMMNLELVVQSHAHDVPREVSTGRC